MPKTTTKEVCDKHLLGTIIDIEQRAREISTLRGIEDLLQSMLIDEIAELKRLVKQQPIYTD